MQHCGVLRLPRMPPQSFAGAQVPSSRLRARFHASCDVHAEQLGLPPQPPPCPSSGMPRFRGSPFAAVPGPSVMSTASTIILETSSRVRPFKSLMDRRLPGGNGRLRTLLFQLPARPILRATVPSANVDPRLSKGVYDWHLYSFGIEGF